MADADRHEMGSAAQGKGTGTGAMTDLPDGILEQNRVLSNRDKSRHNDTSRHNDERGLDGKRVQTEQYQDHAAHREVDPDEVEFGVSGDGSALARTTTDLSGAQGGLAGPSRD